MSAPLDHAVIGGGLFGCFIAIELARSGKRVLLVEEKDQLLGRASYSNQARVHGGYHYPRSFLTANRTRVNFHRFSDAFDACVVRNFQCYYAIAREFSLVSARQFQEFSNRIGAPVREAPAAIRRLFDVNLIESVFEVEEFVFDATLLREMLGQQLQEAGVEVSLGTRAVRVQKSATAGLDLTLLRNEITDSARAREVWLCTYGELNEVLLESGLPGIPLNCELTEIALVTPPDELQDVGVTLMDGPFFSLMPFPAEQTHSLTHVRYTPHATWRAGDGVSEEHRLGDFAPRSNFRLMQRDAARFIPAMQRCEYRKSLFEVKAKLPRSAFNDSRPILFRRDHGVPGLHCVLGGKIDSVYDIEEAMSA